MKRCFRLSPLVSETHPADYLECASSSSLTFVSTSPARHNSHPSLPTLFFDRAVSSRIFRLSFRGRRILYMPIPHRCPIEFSKKEISYIIDRENSTSVIVQTITN